MRNSSKARPANQDKTKPAKPTASLQQAIEQAFANIERQGLSPLPLPTQSEHESSQFENPELAGLSARIEVMESILREIHSVLVNLEPVQDWYSVAEVASMLSRADFTVREWARLGRINASKRESGRGRTKEWMISRAELQRLRNEGLLPR